MVAYHINPENGRAGKCTAKNKCRYADAIHGETIELARIRYEESQMSSTVPTGLSKNQPLHSETLTPTEFKLLSQRLRNQLLTKDFNKINIDANTPVEVFFRQNSTCSFNYQNVDTNDTFTRGACAILAHALHEKTQLPFTILTIDDNAKSWSGHVAVQLGSNSFLDINGVQSKDSLLNTVPGLRDKNSKIEENVSLKDFKTRMGLTEEQDVYRNLDKLERAMLDRICRDVLRDCLPQ